ncbi:hypothetical protein ABT147_12935 [Streptomyces sp. NPDC001868]|uniref:hypothetical protein n=1 Tax=Streptomyces sp. NPDC001868 TaxID=3154401 RepID=UPI0033331F87
MRKNRSATLAAATFLLVTGAAIAAAPSAYAGVPGSTSYNAASLGAPHVGALFGSAIDE